MSQTNPLRIAICGAGVAGSIVTHLLAHEPGVEVICLDRVDADDHSHAGTGLNVGPNALKALAAADPALVERIRAPGVSLPWSSWRTTLTDGRELMNLPLSEVADNDGIRIRWSELYRQLRSPVLDRIRFNQTLVAMDYADHAPGAPIELSYQDRASGANTRLTDVDLLIGGDGRYSEVRRHFIGEPEPEPLGVVIYRVLVPDTADGLIDEYEQWFNGPNRLLAFRVPGNAIYIAGSFPIMPGASVDQDAKSAEHLRTLYSPADRPASAQAQFLIDAICDHVNEIHWARVAQIPPVFTDSRGRVLLLGDAAHAMSPTLGQGATQAIEDACLCADRIRAAVRTARAAGTAVDVPALCREVEAQRLERVRFVMDLSWTASATMLAGSDPVAGNLAKNEPAFRQKLTRLYTDTPALTTV